MKKFNYIIIASICLMFYSQFRGQNTFSEQIKSVYNSYRSTDKFQTDITIEVFNFRETIVVQKAQIKKSGNNFHYALEGKRVLMNNKYMITLEKENKQITVAKALSNEVLNSDFFGEEEMKNTLKKVDTIIDNGNANGIQKYTVISKNNLIQKMELSINTKFQMLSKVVYYYNESAGLNSTKVIINYNNLTTSPTFSSSEFSEKRYITKNGDIYSPSKAYKGYEVLKIKDDVFND